MLDSILDALFDSLKILPYLLVTFLLLELIEHKFSKKSQKILSERRKLGPLIGGVIGALPQCGFSAMAANLFSNRVITIGTLIAIFLSTSDEMLPVMLSEGADPSIMLKIIGAKVLIAIILGFIIDFFYAKIAPKQNAKEIVKELCEHDHCGCEKDKILTSAIKHTLKTIAFVLGINLIINLIIFYIGEENLSNLLLGGNIFTYFLASLIGLVPNCAGSIIITELYLSGLITIGTLFAGLLTGSGIGILLLFKSNKNIKQNINILVTIYLVGVIVGLIVDLLF